MRSEEAKRRKTEYARKWRKKNPQKQARIMLKYWMKRYEQIMNMNQGKTKEMEESV